MTPAERAQRIQAMRDELLDRTEANPYGATELAELNDRHGHSFLQLADCIEVSL